jgi:uncharacterized protein DUF5615
VDEDLASDELMARLDRVAGLTPITPVRGASDADVWERARAERAAILTGNVVDLLRLAAEQPRHHGLLLLYRQNDRARELRAADVAAAVALVISDHPDGIEGLVLVVNDLVRR